MPKKIVFLTNSAWGTFRYRVPLFQALVKRGYQLQLMAPFDGYFDPLKKLVPELEILELKYMDTGSFSPLKNLHLVLEIKQQLSTNKPDLVVMTTIKPILFGNINCRLLGLKTLTIFEGFGFSASKKNYLSSLFQYALKYTCKNSDYTIFLNQTDAQAFREGSKRLFQKSNVINGCGINTDAYVPEHRSNKSPFIFLHSGRFISEKGLHYMMESSRILRNEGFEFQCHLLGRIDKKNPTALEESTLEKWENEGLAEHKGFHDNVQPFYNAADAFVFPSYYREGLPQANLEALACGLPIITTDMPGCRETVQDGWNGYMIEPKNQQALTDAMRRMLQNSEEEQKRFSENSRKLSIEKFSIQTIIPKYIDIIEHLL